jgi:hypothetical protein
MNIYMPIDCITTSDPCATCGVSDHFAGCFQATLWPLAPTPFSIHFSARDPFGRRRPTEAGKGKAQADMDNRDSNR